ncbi:hypothetical protein, partial [Bradyrhizobium sp.]|uniref:hypothetical protein n=1 Tax=Bradyrhizobium sp. TaxID=376 RepID=UPI00391C2EB3
MRQQELFSVMTGIGMPYDIKLIFPHSINANALRPAREAPHEKMFAAREPLWRDVASGGGPLKSRP